VFICIVAALFTFVYLKCTYILESTVPIPWLLIMDSRSVYSYTSHNTYIGYSLWTLVLAPRSSLSQPTKWLVCFLSPQPLTGGAKRVARHRHQSFCFHKRAHLGQKWLKRMASTDEPLGLTCVPCSNGGKRVQGH